MRRLLALLILLLCNGAYAQPVPFVDDAEAELEEAQTPRELAKAHFKMGVNFYKNMNYTAALIEFKHAHKTSPHFKVLFNLGQVSLDLHDYVAAVDYLESYIKQGGSDVSVARIDEVNGMLDRLRGLIASLEISVNVDDAEVFIDNSPVGRSPMPKRVRVSAGRIKVTALKKGMQLAERHVDIAAGELARVELNLIPILVGPSESEAEAQDGPVDSLPDLAYQHVADSGGVSGTVVMGLVTGALAIGSGVMTVITMNAKTAYDDELAGNVSTTAAKINSLRNNAKRKAWVTDGLYAATLVSAITTLIVGLSSDDEITDRDIEFGVTPSSVAVRGQF